VRVRRERAVSAPPRKARDTHFNSRGYARLPPAWSLYLIERPCHSAPGPAPRLKDLDLRQRMSAAAKTDAGAILLIGGVARTFWCTIDSIERFAARLGADVYAYVKTSDPGPKLQEGHDFSYPQQNSTALELRLKQTPGFVGAKIVSDEPCDRRCSMQQVACRGRFNVFFEGRFGDHHLARAVQQHLVLATLGRALLRIEAARGHRYAVIAFSRPDVRLSLEVRALSSYVGAEGKERFLPCNDGHGDFHRLLVREQAEYYFFGAMRIYRAPCREHRRSYGNSEAVLSAACRQRSSFNTTEGRCGGCLASEGGAASVPVRFCSHTLYAQAGSNASVAHHASSRRYR